MHLQEVRIVRHHRNPRYDVRVGGEHHQREDLHFHLVLARVSDGHHRPVARLPRAHHRLLRRPLQAPSGSWSLGRPTKPGLSGKEVQFRRLVLDIPPRAQHGAHGVWRVLERVCQGVGKFSLDAGTQANASW